jgi:hypothetical protein
LRSFRRVTVQPEWVQALLLGMGTMIAAGTFWFKEFYEPAVTPATLNISPVLEMIGRRGDDLLVRASLNVENRGTYRVYVPAFWYTVHGYCFRPRAISPDSYAVALRGWSGGGMQSRFNEPATGELLVAGRPSRHKNTHFDPGSERHYEELFLVPAGQYAALRMEVHYMVAKDVSAVDSTHWRQADQQVGEQVFLPTRQPAEGPWMLAWARAGTTTSEAYQGGKHDDWRKRAGAALGWSHSTLSLWPVSGARPAPAAAGSRSDSGCAVDGG